MTKDERTGELAHGACPLTLSPILAVFALVQRALERGSVLEGLVFADCGEEECDLFSVFGDGFTSPAVFAGTRRVQVIAGS